MIKVNDINIPHIEYKFNRNLKWLIDLNEVINSYGMNVSNADITDIIIKAKHLSDIGKAGNL